MGVRIALLVVCSIALCALSFSNLASGDYLKKPLSGEDPPDADKPAPLSDLSCWLATAANMLAAAGYGTGGLPVQQRADEIYTQLRFEFGTYT